jgi:hypothetical protein
MPLSWSQRFKDYLWLKALVALMTSQYLLLKTLLERWPSGLRRSPGKRMCGQKLHLGFKSLSLRQNSVQDDETPTFQKLWEFVFLGDFHFNTAYLPHIDFSWVSLEAA